MATYAIGDIQGCFDEFIELLDMVGFNVTRDRLWLVGDLVNRGPQSLEVLRYVKTLGAAATVVLGNHDLHLIMRAAGHGRASKGDTLDEVLAAPDCAELMQWLRQFPLFHTEDEYAMVHAGLLPGWSIAQAEDLGAEVNLALTSETYLDFLANMWGSEPDHWKNGLRSWDRLRVVVNAMTRMRFCTPDGVMDLRSKGVPESAPKGFMPWFAVPGRASISHTLVCGHWSALGFYREKKLLALDSGCLWGGALTVVRLEDQKAFQLPCPQRLVIDQSD